MPLFLTGYRGTGKTTVAGLLAEIIQADWVDADVEIEKRAGKSIAKIFADEGEPHFRDLEAEVVADLCKTDRVVVALGGGAILRAATRSRLSKAGPVVWLTASPKTLADRIHFDATSVERRPSLTEAKSMLEEVTEVLKARTPLYEECATLSLDTESQTPEQIAREIADWLERDPRFNDLSAY